MSGSARPVRSASGTKVAGQHRADDLVGPARERLHADHAPLRQVELGLVVHRDRAHVDRALERGHEDEPPRRLLLDVEREVLAPRLGPLRAVHRGLGALEEEVGVLGVLGRAGDADGGVHAQRRARHVHLAAELGEEVVGGERGVAAAGEARQEHAEAVGLHARDHVGGADRAREPRADLLEDGVALFAAERVVHVAEAVEVDDEQRELLVAVPVAERALGRLKQEGAVRQAGQRVVERQVLHRGRLHRGAVHGRHREREQRDEVEPVHRDHRDREAEREQRAGGPGAEGEVGLVVAHDRGVLEQRLGGAGERGVDDEEDAGGERDGGQVGGLEVLAVRRGRCRPRPRARGRRRPTRSRAGRALKTMRSAGRRRIRSATSDGDHLDGDHLGQAVDEQQRERERRGEGLLADLSMDLDREQLAGEDERGEDPELGVVVAEVAAAGDQRARRAPRCPPRLRVADRG